MKDILKSIGFLIVTINSVYSQNTINAYSDASVEIIVHKVPVNVLGGSLNPIEVKNKSVRGIKNVIVIVDCDCEKGPSVSQRVSFNRIDGYSSGKDILSNVDCNGLVTNCVGQLISIERERDDNTNNQDEFWTGEKQTSVPSNSGSTSNNKQEDFWSGSKQIEPVKSNSDNQGFWKGKGTIDEEKYFETHTVTKESNQFIGEIESRTKTITIICRDHGEEDGDRVKIVHNKRIIQSNLYLTNSSKRFEVTLDFGMNRVDFEALNQGSAGPNTATFEVYDDSGRKISSKQWNILTGYSATLLVLKL